MSLTMILLTASVGCNLWFLFLLLYDRIMETKLIRFFRNLAGLWQALDNTAEKQEAEKEAPAEEMPDIIGKSRFKMTPTRTTATTPVPHAATSEKVDETFTSIQPSELEFGKDEPEEDDSDLPRASGSSFDEIDKAVKTAKNPKATKKECEQAAKVFTEMEGTELYDKLMAGSTELSIRIKGLIEIRFQKPKKEFVVPDNIEDFDIRDYV